MKRRAPWRIPLSDFIGNYIDGRAEEEYAPIWACARDPRSLGRAAWQAADGGYAVHGLIDFEPDGTFVLLAPNREACGFYMDAQCWIDPAHRGQKLSTPLILAAAAHLGDTPVRDAHWGVGFSDAGLKAHIAAWRHAVGEALAAGRPVPGSVLREFRELAGDASTPRHRAPRLVPASPHPTP